MPDLVELRAFRSAQPEVDSAIEQQARRALLLAAAAPPAKRHLVRRSLAICCAVAAVAGGGVAYAAGVTVASVATFVTGPSEAELEASRFEPPSAEMDALDALADYATKVGEQTPSYAGLRIDAAARQIVVSTTDADPASHAAYLKPGADSGSYRFVLSAISYEKMLQVRDQIIADRDALMAQGIDVRDGGPDVFTNSIRIGVVNLTATTQSILQRRYGTDRIYVLQSGGVWTSPWRGPTGRPAPR